MPVSIKDQPGQPVSASAETVKAAQKSLKSVTFKDSTGREIVIRQQLPYDVYNFDKFAGNSNQKTYETLLTAYHVFSIDGKAVAKSSLLQVEHLLQRLGEAFDEIQAEVIIMNAEKTKSLSELMEKVKNALSTPDSETVSE